METGIRREFPFFSLKFQIIAYSFTFSKNLVLFTTVHIVFNRHERLEHELKEMLELPVQRYEVYDLK